MDEPIFVVQIGPDWYAVKPTGAGIVDCVLAEVIAGPFPTVLELAQALRSRKDLNRFLDTLDP